MVEEIKKRTKQIGLEVIKLCEIIPNNHAGRAISGQIIRSGTSIGANYRAACRAKSTADFINKLKIVEEEADETIFWLEILEESSMVKSENTAYLKKEANEILSITIATIKKMRLKQLEKQKINVL